MPYSSEYFEPVRDGGLTVQGFAGIFEKAGFDLGRQQVMCSWNGWVWWEIISWQTERYYSKKG